MIDDRELLDQLERALRPGAVEPPPARVQALRRLVTRRAPLRVLSPDHATERAVASAPSLPVPARQVPGGDRGLAIAFSGVAAALILLVAVIVAVRGLPNSSGPPERVLEAQNAAYRVQLALDRKDAAEVAKTDVEMLRAADKLAGDERKALEKVAVPLHVQAIAFLRDHASPEILADVPGAVIPGGTDSPTGNTDSALPSLPSLTSLPVPADVIDPAAPVVVPPLPVDTPSTTLVGPVNVPSLTITGITPRLDGSFDVNFTTSGFTPDASGAPGTYVIRFSYDGGTDATIYTGDSPWTFPLVNAILYRQVCGEIVDAAGDVVPSSSSCTNIINL